MGLHADLAVRRDRFEVCGRARGRPTARPSRSSDPTAPASPRSSTRWRARSKLAEGTIELDGERIDRLPPERRPSASCFQDDLLFPHLSALENVAFPLRARGHAQGGPRTLAGAVGRPRTGHRPRPRRPGRSSPEASAARRARARARAASRGCCCWTSLQPAWTSRARPGLRALVRDVARGFDGAGVLSRTTRSTRSPSPTASRCSSTAGSTQSGTPEEIRRAPRIGRTRPTWSA